MSLQSPYKLYNNKVSPDEPYTSVHRKRQSLIVNPLNVLMHNRSQNGLQQASPNAQIRWHSKGYIDGWYDKYMTSVQAKFKKYRTNIYQLNHAAIKIQHWFFKVKRAIEDKKSKVEAVKRVSLDRSLNCSPYQFSKIVQVNQEQLGQSVMYQRPIQKNKHVSQLTSPPNANLLIPNGPMSGPISLDSSLHLPQKHEREDLSICSSNSIDFDHLIGLLDDFSKQAQQPKELAQPTKEKRNSTLLSPTRAAQAKYGSRFNYNGNNNSQQSTAKNSQRSSAQQSDHSTVKTTSRNAPVLPKGECSVGKQRIVKTERQKTEVQMVVATKPLQLKSKLTKIASEKSILPLTTMNQKSSKLRLNYHFEVSTPKVDPTEDESPSKKFCAALNPKLQRKNPTIRNSISNTLKVNPSGFNNHLSLMVKHVNVNLGSGQPVVEQAKPIPAPVLKTQMTPTARPKSFGLSSTTKARSNLSKEKSIRRRAAPLIEVSIANPEEDCTTPSLLMQLHQTSKSELKPRNHTLLSTTKKIYHFNDIIYL